MRECAGAAGGFGAATSSACMLNRGSACIMIFNNNRAHVVLKLLRDPMQEAAGGARAHPAPSALPWPSTQPRFHTQAERRRRLVKRVYIPMPDAPARRALLQHVLRGQPARLSRADMEALVCSTDGFSGSDLAALCREAAMVPLRCALQGPM